MNVRCPQCETTFRVDPERIPAAGIKARCAKCSTVFELSRQGASAARPKPAPAPAMAGGAPSAPAAPAPQPRLSVVAPTPTPAPPAAPAPSEPAPRQPEPPAAAAPAAAPTTPRPLPPRDSTPPSAGAMPAPQAAPAGTGAPTTKRASFRNQDPGARAQRLARALVSDIVAYNKDKVQQATSPAALRTEFREEIRKSWEEYVEQVGLELAKSTPYFRDALNEILAKGQKVF